MEVNEIITPYFENEVFAGVRVTLGDEDFVIAPKDHHYGKVTQREAMKALKADNLITWNYKQACFIIAYRDKINDIMESNGGESINGYYWTYTQSEDSQIYIYEYNKFITFGCYNGSYLDCRVRPIKNLKTV